MVRHGQEQWRKLQGRVRRRGTRQRTAAQVPQGLRGPERQRHARLRRADHTAACENRRHYVERLRHILRGRIRIPARRQAAGTLRRQVLHRQRHARNRRRLERAYYVAQRWQRRAAHLLHGARVRIWR